jgi:hypothetical protein
MILFDINIYLQLYPDCIIDDMLLVDDLFILIFVFIFVFILLLTLVLFELSFITLVDLIDYYYLTLNIIVNYYFYSL